MILQFNISVKLNSICCFGWVRHLIDTTDRNWFSWSNCKNKFEISCSHFTVLKTSNIIIWCKCFPIWCLTRENLKNKIARIVIISDKHKPQACNKAWTDTMRRVLCCWYKELEIVVIYLLQTDFHSHVELTVDYLYKVSILSCFILSKTLFVNVYLSKMHKQK